MSRWAGYAIWTYENGKVERDLLACVHCTAQWYVKPGSGNKRGWCFMCAGPTCGAKACEPCIPFEKKIEMIVAREDLFEALMSR